MDWVVAISLVVLLILLIVAVALALRCGRGGRCGSCKRPKSDCYCRPKKKKGKKNKCEEDNECGKGKKKKTRGCRCCADVAVDHQTEPVEGLTAVDGSDVAENDTGFVPILSTTLCTSEECRLLDCAVSAYTAIGSVEAAGPDEAALYVSAEVASITFRVLVDGNEAEPGTITFDNSTHVFVQNLSAEDLRVELEEHGSAKSFHFFLNAPCAGSHTIEVLARLQTFAGANEALATSSAALIGPRSLVVTPHKLCPHACCAVAR